MKVTIAYIEEPPFGWTEADSTPTGADIDLADAVLRAIGVTRIEHHPTSFSELLPGVEAGRWDMNVPLFVTRERANMVAFSVPVWGIADGFLVRTGNPKALDSYVSLAKRADARLGIIAGQVQHDSAKASGVSEDQIVVFEHQADAVEAVLSGAVDAYASTALGNRIIANRIGGSMLEAIEHEPGTNGKQQKPPLGAFSFNRSNSDLIQAVNKALRSYLGSPDHRARMAEFGLTNNEIDPALAGRV
ncbi:polar amino acid transport system substrate-binding protein [Paraburkholderia sp. HC6.4b]|uniref:transporter substrate-binding domain-containing protein n=1 Tax=unclassified Paraburkholderia TaxID=2615204 RepID=UPI00162100D4|nr:MULTISPECIES: transporter substrate-binding domain-containing protein [unclassified Paraburkholderia]MBB5409689.1 polar amino acid transport system substrate-binding protein [Paraburkholderia sp. HC6.4b]MBB5451664.1 polar amino acid transport system substrate-binding protein [Paraburkholderia sp. Kb1A]